MNLVSSEAWETVVGPYVRSSGFEVLHYLPLGSRVLATTGAFPGPVLRPEDIAGKRIRVGASRALRLFYRLCGAVPVPVPWSDLHREVASGQADVLDPSAPVLLSSGLGEYVNSISYVGAVAYGHALTVNRDWLESLPAALRQAVRQAAAAACLELLEGSAAHYREAKQGLESAGVRIARMDDGARQRWRGQAGAQRAEWDELKAALAGSGGDFDRLDGVVNADGPWTGRLPQPDFLDTV